LEKSFSTRKTLGRFVKGGDKFDHILRATGLSERIGLAHGRE